MRAFLLSTVVATLAAGCAPTVRVEIAPSPAYALPTNAVAVVARDRECREVADALVQNLNALPGFEVDPRSEVRLDVSACGQFFQWDLVREIDASNRSERRSVTLDGRAHAVVAVSAYGAVQAHLIGSGHHLNRGGWRDAPIRDTIERTRSAQRYLVDAVAIDLATQLSPVPQLVQRRLYPNANPDTARDLYNQAVLAEVSGDIDEALRLARAAHDERPSPRAASYLSELERRRNLGIPSH